MIHLAHEIITGKRTIETLTLEECLGGFPPAGGFVFV